MNTLTTETGASVPGVRDESQQGRTAGAGRASIWQTHWENHRNEIVYAVIVGVLVGWLFFLAAAKATATWPFEQLTGQVQVLDSNGNPLMGVTARVNGVEYGESNAAGLVTVPDEGELDLFDPSGQLLIKCVCMPQYCKHFMYSIMAHGKIKLYVRHLAALTGQNKSTGSHGFT